MLYNRIKWLIILLVLGLASSCIDSDENSSDTFQELTRIYAPDSSKYILFYQYKEESGNNNTAFITVIKKNDRVNLKNQYYFSSFDLDTIYWLTKDTIVAAEKFITYLNKGKSNYKDSLYLINNAAIRIVQLDPVDSSFIHETIYKQTSPDKQQEVTVFRYLNPQNNYSILNVSFRNRESKPGKYGNFYIGKGDFDCIKDIRWDSTEHLTIKASERCYYGFEEYLIKNRPLVHYKLLKSNEDGNTKSSAASLFVSDTTETHIE